ncbi:uncharacterized protein YbjT (DUF2867 family) [Pseudorhodobacter sp. 4114]|nr:uncharacterized protein YbjT (DUF2867 family) [Pseudorhodobacter sp. 4114]
MTIVTRDEGNGADLKAVGAKIAATDIRDIEATRSVLRSGTRAFLLNPPAHPSGDTGAEERANVAAIISALGGSGLEKVVAQSTYGAFCGERCGDLTVLHQFETALARQPVPTAINRCAYDMSNWTGMADVVQETGTLPSFFPAGLSIPMVAPADLGEAAAKRLMAGISAAVIHGDLDAGMRRRILAAYAAGKIRVVVNVAVLTEGWDHPSTSCVVLLRPSAGIMTFMIDGSH